MKGGNSYMEKGNRFVQTADKFLTSLKEEWIPDLKHRWREEYDSEIQKACNNERDTNIRLAALALLEVGTNDDVAANVLQKYWDLRPSQAQRFIEWAHLKLET